MISSLVSSESSRVFNGSADVGSRNTADKASSNFQAQLGELQAVAPGPEARQKTADPVLNSGGAASAADDRIRQVLATISVAHALSNQSAPASAAIAEVSSSQTGVRSHAAGGVVGSSSLAGPTSPSGAVPAAITAGTGTTFPTGYYGYGPASGATSNVSDWDIQQWLQQNPSATPLEVFAAMQKYRVNIDQLSRATGISSQGLMQKAARSGISPNQVAGAGLMPALADIRNGTDEGPMNQIRDWLSENPNASPSEIVQAASRYGVNLSQIARVTGIDGGQLMEMANEAGVSNQELSQLGIIGPMGAHQLGGMIEWGVRAGWLSSGLLAAQRAFDGDASATGFTPAEMALYQDYRANGYWGPTGSGDPLTELRAAGLA